MLLSMAAAEVLSDHAVSRSMVRARQVNPMLMMVNPVEHVVLQRPEFPYPRDTLRPGRVVWAKVEGHDWWPAKIVRRRAVPREVRRVRPTGAAAAWCEGTY